MYTIICLRHDKKIKKKKPFVIIIIILINRRCWMHESHCQWVLTVPVFASILTSLMFLMNVMRVLLTKLHRNSTNPAPIGVRKAVRAALILVPLFGIHYILIPYRPKHKTTVETVYQIFSVILVSTQVSETVTLQKTPAF